MKQNYILNKEIKKGFINSYLPWYSPKDLSNFLGKTRQYWCKLIKQGKIKAHQTSAGPIITTEQLVEYYDNKEWLYHG